MVINVPPTATFMMTDEFGNNNPNNHFNPSSPSTYYNG